MSHPCQSCGACCAAYRVAFHWSEADAAAGGTVPVASVVRWDAHRVALRGTDRREPRCDQLEGTVGVSVHCAIYPQRPSPCRELEPAWVAGRPSPQCDRARERYGLRPLTPDDWRA
jgi:Fe-S-cluster containining protein